MTTEQEALREAREIYWQYMEEIAATRGDALAIGEKEKCLRGDLDHQHGVQIALRALTRSQSTNEGEGVGWIVANGRGDLWRTWKYGWSSWTGVREHATRYARREDAEAVHREDEEAWLVQPYAAPDSIGSHFGNGGAFDPGRIRDEALEEAAKVAAGIILSARMGEVDTDLRSIGHCLEAAIRQMIGGKA